MDMLEPEMPTGDTLPDAAHLVFLAPGSTTPHVIEPEDICWLAVLGEVGTAVAQYVADQLRGGYAAVACSRAQAIA